MYGFQFAIDVTVTAVEAVILRWNQELDELANLVM